MKKVSDYSEVVALRGKVKKDYPRMVTNLSAFPDEIKEWIARGELYSATIEEPGILLRRREFEQSLYFFAPDFTSAEESIRNVAQEENECGLPLVIETISRTPEPMLAVPLAMSLNRMSRIGTPDYKEESSLEVCRLTTDHVPEVRTILLDQFNPLCENIPEEQELASLFNNETGVAYMKDGKTQGLMIAQKDRTTLHLRYWWVSPLMRNAGIGSLLLNEFFRLAQDTQRQILWVDVNNENAIKRYRHYGFAEEKMYDHIHVVNIVN